MDRSGPLQGRKYALGDTVDKIKTKYEKVNRDNKSRVQRSKQEKLLKAVNRRTYYSREESEKSSRSCFGFPMHVVSMNTRRSLEDSSFLFQISSSLQRMEISSRRNDVTPYHVIHTLVEKARHQVDHR